MAEPMKAVVRVQKAAPPDPRKKLMLYGGSKTVKTPAALAYLAYLRTLNPNARALYWASDEGSEGLPSIPNESWRDHIDVITTSTPLDDNYDPYRDAITVAMTDWKKQDPNYELFIWDTQARTLQRILQFISNKAYFQGKGGDKHVTIGEGDPGKPNSTAMNLPQVADYGAIVGIGLRLMECLAAQKMHVLILSHEEETKGKDGIRRIGPAAVGKALVEDIPAFLTGVMYTEKKGEVDPKTGKLVPTLHIYSDCGDDLHMAGVRHAPINGDPRNPLTKVKVGTDLVAFWKKWFETLYPNEQALLAGKE